MSYTRNVGHVMNIEFLPNTPEWALSIANNFLSNQYKIIAPPVWNKVTIERAPCLNVAWRVILHEVIHEIYLVEISGTGEVLYSKMIGLR